MTMGSSSIMSVPPWPSDVPTASLNTLSLAKLLQNDEAELAALFASCKSSGFFLLDLRGCKNGEDLLADTEKLFHLAKELNGMPNEEKKQYALAPGTAFGYKAIGISKVDSKGTPDRCEFWGLSKDAIFSHDTQAGTMPPLVTSNTTLLRDFASRSHSIGLYILTHLEKHFNFPESALTSVHRLSARSSDQIRLLKMPPQPTTDRGTSLLAHTDFGSITLLWNVVGGLQILPREAGTSDVDGTSDRWQYVQPQPGCVIVNMGDAIVTLTNGALSSNLHRVTTPPGAQADLVRYSAVYFMRPEDDILMRPLGDGPADRALKEESGENGERKYHTVKEWVALKTASFQKALAPMQSNGGIASYEG